MADSKSIYLIWGEDEVKLDNWRSRAHEASKDATTTLDVLKGERLSVQSAIEALGSLTLSVGRRYVLLDGIERWKDRDAALFGDALAAVAPDTVVILIASGLPPRKGPARLIKAVEAAGGKVYPAPKPANYRVWIVEQARDLGLSLSRDAAETLVDLIGPNQHRLVRELEKLAMFAGEESHLTAEMVAALAAPAVEARTYELADALIEGDRARALSIAEELRARGEDMMHILFALLRQVQNCHKAWAMLAAGSSVRDIEAALPVPTFVARRVVAQARRVDGERLERALDMLADLDYAIRGVGDLDPDSSLTLTLAEAATERAPPVSG